jgi:hypothetical protein
MKEENVRQNSALAVFKIANMNNKTDGDGGKL